MSELLILGNGASRTQCEEFIESWDSEIWVCNWGYLEVEKLSGISKVYTVHSEVIQEAIKFREITGHEFSIVTRKQLLNSVGGDEIFQSNKGWATGSMAILDAVLLGYDRIVLAGYDFGGQDIYQPHMIPGSNFIKQFKNIISDHGDEIIEFATPSGLMRCKNYFDTLATPTKQIPVIQDTGKPSFFLNPKKSVIIIGNSPTVRDQELGEFIDRFDVVVRLNDYMIEGYEKNVGTKTDIWFSGASLHAKVKERRVKNIQVIFGLPYHRIKTRETTPREFYRDIEHSLKIPIGKASYVSPKEVDTIRRKYDLLNPTTGFLAIAYFLDILKNENIHLYGFDFFENRFHYFDEKSPRPPIGDGHDYAKEKATVHKMVSKNRLKWFTEKTEVTSIEDSPYKEQGGAETKKFLILGNSPSIKWINWAKVRENLSIPIAGVNRIFLLFQPDIFFFIDDHIRQELQEQGIERKPHSRWVAPEYIFNNVYSKTPKEARGWLEEQGTEITNFDFSTFTHRTSSIGWLLRYLQYGECKGSKCEFYIHGVDLTITEDYNHFWGDEYKSKNPATIEQMQFFFQSQYNGFMEMHRSGVKMFSLSPTSRLNEFLPYYSFERFVSENSNVQGN